MSGGRLVVVEAARWLEVACNGVWQGCVRVPASVCDGRTKKNERLLGNKQGQRRNVGA